ncbi:NTP transferase domain-containing protein [Halopelagius longus]|uniref:2-phospho-L-lactate guanylyltransferase n=1 Tax=Halopelagius longus TaxID=1236180 RepID=A0A1H0Y3G0_9EURY|nr:NTP transferase domain-containing protein [Halopelagius longus]RDI72253.1 2-phospho-L-lactate guanylyltransferase [Halopelagius longus]SDQ09640.1 phospholactate guanylyltransferase [Halopelagius longus]
MRVVVPYTDRDPKSRLAGRLGESERRAFSRAMLRDVLDAVEGAGHDPVVLATEPVAVSDAPVVVDDRALTPAVNGVLARLGGSDASEDDGGDGSEGGESDNGDGSEGELERGDDEPVAFADVARDGEVAVAMADLALATPEAVRRLADAEGDVVIAPGRGGGTNALVVRHPGFRVDYHGASYRDHRRIAGEAGASVGVLDSMRLSTDVDEPSDLAEVLLHGGGESKRWLREAGFELDVSGGRVGVVREP